MNDNSKHVLKVIEMQLYIQFLKFGKYLERAELRVSVKSAVRAHARKNLHSENAVTLTNSCNIFYLNHFKLQFK